MKYKNPILSGFYPDPSICKANGKYYMVCSSFQYFPGVPLFESEDLINWEQIGHVLTRESQLPLKGAGNAGGIYAPTIRYYQGRFYMVTTNVTNLGNFYVWTDNIYGEWSEPILVEQGGIDPSLYFEDGKAYFMSNGEDDNGEAGIAQCEIDINTGKKLTPSKCIYKGNGGRYLEAPHLYKIGSEYYIMVAEGGTEYGHMVVYAKGATPYGPFENYYGNPVLTNRNLGGYRIQGCGHGDLIEDEQGNYWMVHLAFRQIDRWMPFHVTGREVYLVPVSFKEDGWFEAGVNGITPLEVETDRLSGITKQDTEIIYTLDNTQTGKEWCWLRNPDMSKYEFTEAAIRLWATEVTLENTVDSPTLLAFRQKEMEGEMVCQLEVPEGEAGITLYMNEEHHYDFSVTRQGEEYQVVKRSNIGGMICQQEKVTVSAKEALTLRIELTPKFYGFRVETKSHSFDMGTFQTRYLSSEVACGFTGVMLGLYAQGMEAKQPAVFSNIKCIQKRE